MAYSDLSFYMEKENKEHIDGATQHRNPLKMQGQMMWGTIIS